MQTCVYSRTEGKGGKQVGRLARYVRASRDDPHDRNEEIEREEEGREGTTR